MIDEKIKEFNARQEGNKIFIEKHYQAIIEILMIVMVILAFWQFYENKSTVDRCNAFWIGQTEKSQVIDYSLIPHIDYAEEDKDSGQEKHNYSDDRR